MDIADWRKKIDEADKALLELLNKRAEYSLEIGKIKKVGRLPVYDPKREEEIFLHLEKMNRGPLSHQAVRRLFERIIDESRQIERRL